MSVTPSSHVVGMFTERAAADNAVEELHNSGFNDDQIHYSTPGTSGGFFEDLKSLFTGASSEESNLTRDLTNMGLSSEQAQYYANEYRGGNTILVVNAPGREEQVLGILRQYGAYSAHSTGVQFGGYTPAHPAQQPVEDTPPHDQPVAEGGVQPPVSELETQTPVTQEQFPEDRVHETAPATPLHDVEDQPTHPATSESVAEVQHPAEGGVASEANAENGTGTAHTASEQEQASPVEAPVVAPVDEPWYQASQPAAASPEHEVHHEQAAQPEAPAIEYWHEQQAGDTSTIAHEHRSEDQMAEPVSVATEHEIAEGAPHAHVAAETGAGTLEHGTQDQFAAPATGEYREGESRAEEQHDLQDSEVSTEPQLTAVHAPESEPASVHATEQPDATILQQHAGDQLHTQESAATLPLETAAAEPEPVQSSTATPESETTAATSEPVQSSTATPESETAAVPPDLAQSSPAAPVAETTAAQPAVGGISRPDYASKLQQLQEQLRASQQRLQETRAQLQAAKDHEAQIQTTREQLQAIQQELEAAEAELRETHSRIDQY